jgi:hypothetical protein
MHPSVCHSRFWRRLIGCTATGAGVVLFAKPLLIVTAVIGILATVGFLFWLPIQTAVVGPQRTWQSMCGRGRRWFGPVGQTCRSAGAMARALLEWLTPLVSDVLLEGVSGALVAVVLILAVLGPEAHQPSGVALARAAVVSGALAGVLLALTRRRGGSKAESESETTSSA